MLVTHTRTLRKLECNLFSLGRATMKAPNLNIIANMMIWTTSDKQNVKPMEMATLRSSLHTF